MKTRPHLRLAAAVSLCGAAVLLLVALSGRAQEEEDGPGARKSAEAPRVTVYGQAVYEDTGRPVRRARVVLFNGESRGPELAALTDGRGEFRVGNVPAGRYFAAVDAPGVVSPVSFLPIEELRGEFFDTTEIAGHFDEIELDGKSDKQVTVRARRGAALGGRVTYSDGEPAVGVTLHLMRRSGGRLAGLLLGMNAGAMMGMRTDDRGVYRAAGLPPGEYVVAVSEEADHGGGARRNHILGAADFEAVFGQQLLMTFHPSAASAKDAASVKVGAGEERTGVDIAIADRAAYTVAGVVRARRGGRAVANAKVSVRRADDEDETGKGALFPYGEDSRFSGMTDAEGRWQFRELPEGAYTIRVAPPAEYEGSGANMNSNLNFNGDMGAITNANTIVTSAPPRPRRRLAPTERELRLTEDVTDVVIELGAGARLSGTVSVEGGSPPQYQSVQAIPAEMGLDEMAWAYERVSRATVVNGAFEIEGLASGKYRLRPEGGDGGDLYLKSITWEGRDLLREPLEVSDGAAVRGVRVVYGRNPATLTVRAAAKPGVAPGLVVAFLLPTDAGQVPDADLTRYSCSAAAGGVCSVRVAPGEYLVVTTTPRLGNTAALLSEVRKRAAGAPRVTLAAGEAKTIEVATPEAK